MFIFSLLFFILAMLGAMWLGGGLWLFTDLPSILIVIPPAIFFTLASTSAKSLKETLFLLFGFMAKTPKACQEGLIVLAILGNSALMLGILMTIIGWVSMAQFGEPATFGPAFAVSVLTIVYGLAMKIICYVGSEKLRFVLLAQTRD